MAVFKDGILYVDWECYMLCGREGCNERAHRKWSKYTSYCIACYWIADRRATCTQRKKYKPSWEELRALMVSHCPHCDVEMSYLCRRGKRGNKATLQHYNDGHIGVICHNCNNGHGKSSLGDAYFDIPRTHKYCCVCREVIPRSLMERRGNTHDGLGNRCKPCAASATRAYYKRKGDKSGCV